MSSLSSPVFRGRHQLLILRTDKFGCGRPTDRIIVSIEEHAASISSGQLLSTLKTESPVWADSWSESCTDRFTSEGFFFLVGKNWESSVFDSSLRLCTVDLFKLAGLFFNVLFLWETKIVPLSSIPSFLNPFHISLLGISSSSAAFSVGRGILFGRIILSYLLLDFLHGIKSESTSSSPWSTDGIFSSIK